MVFMTVTSDCFFCTRTCYQKIRDRDRDDYDYDYGRVRLDYKRFMVFC